MKLTEAPAKAFTRNGTAAAAAPAVAEPTAKPKRGKAAKATAKPASEQLKIAPLKQAWLTCEIVGEAGSPYMQNRFSEKAAEKMRATQEAGTQAKSRKNRPPRDFKADFLAAQHLMRVPGSKKLINGIPAAAFRKAMISACRVVDFQMTLARQTIFIEADGIDANDGTPLIAIRGTAVMDVRAVRNDNGSCDLRARPRFDTWSAKVTVRFDEGRFSPSDVFNLLVRAGAQGGVGEGRADCPSGGVGNGHFSVKPGTLQRTPPKRRG